MNEQAGWFWQMMEWLTAHYPHVSGVLLGVSMPVVWWWNDRQSTKSRLKANEIGIQALLDDRDEIKTSLQEVKADIKATNQCIVDADLRNQEQHTDIIKQMGEEVGKLKNTIIDILKP